MEGIRVSLRRAADGADVDGVVVEFVDSILSNWHAEGARGGDAEHEVQRTIEPVLREAGIPEHEWEALWALVHESRSTNEQAGELEVAEAIVPIENPVQMNLSPISVTMAQSQQVQLDWLASKKVVASQVDRSKLDKISSRHRQRAEKRGLRVVARPQNDIDAEVAALSVSAEWDPQVVVNELLEMADGVDGPRICRDLGLQNFDISLGGKRILTNTDMLLSFGRRYGLVGRNGVGKSTLLRNISARQLPIPAGISILHVEQEVAGDDTLVIASVLAADFKREALLAEENRLQAALQNQQLDEKTSKEMSHRLEAVYRVLSETDSSSAEARAAMILNGLGFSPEDQRRSTREFSGGWRMRIALARALFCQPDLLLLDEPTNMLDFPSVVWLEGYLNNWPGTLLVVSHDRCFLDNVATDILHMHNEVLDAYRGNYIQFLTTREERLKNQQREYEAQLQYRQHLQAFIDRWRYNANRAPQAQSRIKILEKLPDLKPVIAEAPVVLRFPPVEPISPPILQLDNVNFQYAADAPLILEGVNFNVQPGSRMAIVGPNGAGKSTLLKLLSGDLEPTLGRLYRHGRLRLGLFTQHHVDQLDLTLNSLQLLQQRFPGKTEEEYRHHLGSFGLSGPLALQTIRTLSGGQKSRVVFTVLSMGRPQIMILDEPTNHLDMDTIDAFIKALREYTGGVLVVSHDKRFIEQLCDEIWVCNNAQLSRFGGSIHDYAHSLLTARQ